MRAAPIRVIVHYPKTQTGQQELAARVAAAHADTVKEYIKRLTCSSEQKKTLADKVMAQTKSSM